MNYYDGKKVQIKDRVACHGVLGTVVADYDSKEYLNDTVRKNWDFNEKGGGILIEQDNGEFSYVDSLTPYQILNDYTPVDPNELELVLVKRGEE